MDINKQSAEENFKKVLEFFDNPEREGLKETPKRYIKFLEQFLSPEPFNMTTFEAEEYEGMVVVANIPFFSLCEHHIAPFFGHASIAYIPNSKTKRIVGLSKLPRVLDNFARRFQNQERITTQVADYINEVLQPEGVAVQITARHLCVEMRGVKKHDTHTTTTKLIGIFKQPEVRAEFFEAIKKR